MNSKQRVHASLAGQPVDRFPVTVPYVQLYVRDHFEELTGRPAWQEEGWLYADPQEHLSLYMEMLKKVYFEILQPQIAPTLEERATFEFIEINGEGFKRNRHSGEVKSLQSISGHAFDDPVNETQYVFDQQDAKERVKIIPAEILIASGINDYIEASVTAFGKDHFILSGGVLGTFYACAEYVGLTNLFGLALEQPELVDTLCKLNLEKNIQIIGQLAAAGGDAIYIDDATTTRDMISVRHFERFSLPYMKEMVAEIHRLGHKAIVIYFGGISDRLEQIASMGADGLLMETSMKGYTNDILSIIRSIGNRVTLYGNIDPVGVLQDGSDAELEAEILRQVTAGKQGRGFIISTGSPVTPTTPLSRVNKYIQLCQQVK